MFYFVEKNHDENGNVIIMLLIAIALLGILTVMLQTSGQESSDISDEQLLINISSVQKYASELENGVTIILSNGNSESDIVFDNSVSETNVFHSSGGAVKNIDAPSSVQTTPSAWEFRGTTAMPGVGTGVADLVAVLPNVTNSFCSKINEINGYSGQPDKGAGDCLTEGADFAGSFSAIPNTLDDTSFSKKPALQGCVKCDATYHFFHVLLKR